MIWHNKKPNLEELAALSENTMVQYLGIEFTEVGDSFIKAQMPVDYRTHQPYGILHGGANCVLAETLGSIASAFVIDHSQYMTLGIEINANHIKSVSSGFVDGICSPIHLGKTLHVWEIKIINEQKKLSSICRLTVLIKKR